MNKVVITLAIIAVISVTAIIVYKPDITVILPPIENFNVGVNYATISWHYDKNQAPDWVLDRDFEIFKESKIKIITICPHWASIESSLGVYDEQVISDYKRVIDRAKSFDIHVIIDFHITAHLTTTSDPDGSYSVPSWVKDYSPDGWHNEETLFRSTIARQAWITMLNHVITSFSSCTNIHSIQILNEPYIGSWALRSQYVTSDSFLDLAQEAKTAIKSIRNVPVTVRYAIDGLYTSWMDNERTYQICDYMSINWYGTEMYSAHTPEKLTEVVAKAKQHGKVVFISECGYKSNDDTLQVQKFRVALDFFKSLNVSYALGWIWYGTLGSGGQLGEGWALNSYIDGTPRSAFDIIKEYNGVT